MDRFKISVGSQSPRAYVYVASGFPQLAYDRSHNEKKSIRRRALPYRPTESDLVYISQTKFGHSLPMDIRNLVLSNLCSDHGHREACGNCSA